MDEKQLRVIFENYIRKFEIINEPHGNDENYKWRLAAPERFPSLINPDAPDFVANLKKIARKSVSYNLFNSRSYYPLGGLITCAKKDESAVRNLFRELFADDGGDLKTRQDKIDAFLGGANAMIDKAYAGRKNFTQYRNDQRSAMSYLFFHNPDGHYLYKYTQARKFAQCVGFEDDWRYGAYFKMDVYHRMCDELVEAIRGYPRLLEATKRRYQEKPWNETPLHKDTNYHILAFDLIWGTGITNHPHYNFGEPSDKLEDSNHSPRDSWKLMTLAGRRKKRAGVTVRAL